MACEASFEAEGGLLAVDANANASASAGDNANAVRTLID